ncbi:MAG: sensor histidine kinase [Acidimicrobiales bacterium]
MRSSRSPSYRRRLQQFSIASIVVVVFSVGALVLGVTRYALATNQASTAALAGLRCLGTFRAMDLHISLEVQRGEPLAPSSYRRTNFVLPCPTSTFRFLPGYPEQVTSFTRAMSALYDFLSLHRAEFSHVGLVDASLAASFSTFNGKVSTTSLRLQQAVVSTANGTAARARRAEEIAIAVALVLGSIGILVLIALTRQTNTQLVAPIEQLAGSMREISNGKIETVISATGFEETQTIAETAETMRRRLLEEISNASKQAILETSIEEQERIALAIHDGPLQVLAALKLRVDILALGEGLSTALSEGLGAVGEGLGRTMEGLRGFIHELDPPDLELGLNRAIESYLDRVRAQLGVNIDFEPVDAEPHRLISEQLHRAIRVAVQNAVVHGRAERITVRLRRTASGYQLTVTDDGTGFDAAVLTDHKLGHLGLFSLRRLIASLGGELQLTSVTSKAVSTWGQVSRNESQTPTIAHGTIMELSIPEDLFDRTSATPTQVEP